MFSEFGVRFFDDVKKLHGILYDVKTFHITRGLNYQMPMYKLHEEWSLKDLCGMISASSFRSVSHILLYLALRQKILFAVFRSVVPHQFVQVKSPFF